MKRQTFFFTALLLFILFACSKEQYVPQYPGNGFELIIGGTNASILTDSIVSPQLDSTSSISRKYRFDIYPDSSGVIELEFTQTFVDDTIDGVYNMVKSIIVKSSGEIATTRNSIKIIQSMNASGDSASMITGQSNEPVFSNIIDVPEHDIIS